MGCVDSFSPGSLRLIPISENFRHIQQRVIDELFDTSQDYEQMPVNFHLTSVYDHSIREAFSRVLHKLIDSLPYLEDLLNVFCSVSAPTRPFVPIDA
jgi:Ras-related GTP-binding protein C/D